MTEMPEPDDQHALDEQARTNIERIAEAGVTMQEAGENLTRNLSIFDLRVGDLGLKEGETVRIHDGDEAYDVVVGPAVEPPTLKNGFTMHLLPYVADPEAGPTMAELNAGIDLTHYVDTVDWPAPARAAAPPVTLFDRLVRLLTRRRHRR